MYYEPSSGREFASTHTFRLAYPDTSFGDLDTEAERNAVGLFTVDERKPAYNPVTHRAERAGVIQKGGAWARDWIVVQHGAETLRGNLLAAVSQRRWEVETGGVTLPGGIQVATGIDDQNRITSVVANAQLAGVVSVDFKAASGWVTLSLEQLRGITAAIALHVQACFAAERAHHDAINAAADADLLTYDVAAGWPVDTEETP
ncbi:DUF4376 domain-containing protein [Alicycliphilus denitrificans]|jgi:hypothetical protein|uniref:DUF4376 domain-containing protein n=1 Tax=Alicycliphilus denitrificans TaxID=179636 RepID=A0A420KBN4_9BURK|nr:DUF4376 domain-containing protein [Alicycliphilus denitrificans]RKJ96623.1 DUF4376 domain-containing protein [Alicycliphilus denitrificans]